MSKHDLRKILTDNLIALMKLSADKQTGAAVGRKTKETHQTTIWRLLNEPLRNPKLDTLSDVAKTFGVAPWALLLPPEDKDFYTVLKAWHSAAPEHKQVILAAAKFAISQLGNDDGKDVPPKGRGPRRK